MRFAALALVALLFPAQASVQQPPTPSPTPGPLQFQEVVTVEGATRDQLYGAALAWFPTAFKSGKDVLQVQDKASGLLVGTGTEPYEPVVFMSSSCTRGVLRYRVTIEVKDGRYRYTIDGVAHEGGTAACHGSGISWGELSTSQTSPDIKGFSAGMEQKMWDDMKEKAAGIAESLAKSLKAKLAAAASQKEW